MAKIGASSMRRGKTNYTYSIIGVAIVLFMLGFMGWIFLIVKQGSNIVKENVPVAAYLITGNKDSINVIKTYIEGQPYAKNVTYVDKQKAKQIWLKDGGEDWDKKILSENPLPESIDFYLRSQYVVEDSIAKIVSGITTRFGGQVGDVQYKKALVGSLNKYADEAFLILVGITIVLSIIVIVSIDNTIRLAMFSNRFLIKTMQMVGATRGFIARPMDLRALLNGFISAVIAIVLLIGFVQLAETVLPDLKAIHNAQLTAVLFGIMIVLGVTISFFSTHRSVMKYLRMRLDDLY